MLLPRPGFFGGPLVGESEGPVWRNERCSLLHISLLSTPYIDFNQSHELTGG